MPLALPRLDLPVNYNKTQLTLNIILHNIKDALLDQKSSYSSGLLSEVPQNMIRYTVFDQL
jgi:hypothetical protein